MSFESLGIKIKHNGGSQQKVQCPNCRVLGKQHLSDTPLSVNIDSGQFNCHKCGWSGSALTNKKMEERNYTRPDRKNFTKLKDVHLQYMSKRGICQDTVNEFKLVSEDNLIVFPYLKNGDLINVKKRSMDKSIFCQGSNCEQIMYNYDNCFGSKEITIVEGECFHPISEILTIDGWVQFKSIDENMKVAQVDDNFQISFIKPNFIIKKEYDGELIEFKNSQKYYSITTPNHNLVVIKNNKLCKKTAIYEFETKTNNKIPRSAHYDGMGIDLSDWQIKLQVAVSADFTIRDSGDIYACFKKERKVKRIVEILDHLKLRYSNNLDNRGYNSIFIHKGQRLSYLTKEFNHSWISVLSNRQINLILDEILYWDGNSVPNRRQIEYSSKLISNSIFIQTLAHLNGWCSTIISRKNKFGKWFKVSILFNKKESSFQGMTKNKIKYNGYVYCVNVDTGMILVRQNNCISISGNCDALAYYQAGIKSVTSVSQGAPNEKDKNIDKKLACITNSYELFEQAEIIYLAVDMDANGNRLKNELIRRFGFEKCKIVDFKECKDANEYLLTHGSDELRKTIENAKDVKIAGVFTVEDVFENMIYSFEKGKLRGTTTYINLFDERWTWRPGEVTMWSGYSNEGKSALFTQLAILKAYHEGWKFALFSPENTPIEDLFDDLIHCFVGKSTDKHFNNVMSKSEYIEASKFIKDHFYVIDPGEDENFQLTTILDKFKILIRKYGVRGCLIDPYNQIEHLMEKGQREDLYISKFMTQLKRFSVINNISMNLVAHQTTPIIVRGETNYPRPDQYKIKGGGTFTDKADNVILVHRPNRRSNPTDRTVRVYVEKIKKQRLVGLPGEFDLFYSRSKNQYFETMDEAISYRNVDTVPKNKDINATIESNKEDDTLDSLMPVNSVFDVNSRYEKSTDNPF